MKKKYNKEYHYQNNREIMNEDILSNMFGCDTYCVC